METDLALLSRYHHHRDAEAFRQLVEMHASMVHATARRVTQDAALAKDVAQETFLALARSSGSAIQCVGAWLHHAAWRKALMLVRSESRRHAYESAAAQHQPTSTEADWSELEPVLDGALADLPELRRQFVIERFLEGRTQQEIAARSGLSQSTVSRQIDQGITELQMKLKSRGVIASVTGLTALLAENALQALPPALSVSFGKIALSGVGASTASSTALSWITGLIMNTQLTKAALFAVVVTMAWVGHDLASSHPKLQFLLGSSTVEPPSSKDRSASASAADKGLNSQRTAARSTQASSSIPSGALSAGATKTAGKSFSALVLARFSRLNREKDFKDFITKLYASGDKQFVADEIERVLGIKLDAAGLDQGMKSPGLLQMVLLSHMTNLHPEETLSWMALYEDDLRGLGSFIFWSIFRERPEITIESLDSTLPVGPHREQILSLFRARRNPTGEAMRVISTVRGTSARREHLSVLAELWPKDQILAGVEWGLQNLSGQDLQAFLPRVAQQLSVSSPEDALDVLAGIQDPELLMLTSVDTMHGLVHEHRRMDDVLKVIDRLQGPQRANAIAEIGRRWIRVDEAGLVQWINGLESAADFEAALPLTLPQLSSESYRRTMDDLMSKLDPGLEAALIKSAMPELTKTNRSSADIIKRLIGLPQYQGIAAGQGGNQALLWQAVNRTAERWVQYQGGMPQDGARWIDSLPFRSPADKAMVAGKLYAQWKLNDPAAANEWAASAGVAIR